MADPEFVRRQIAAELAARKGLPRMPGDPLPEPQGGIQSIPVAGEFDPMRGFATHELNRFGEPTPIPSILPVRPTTEREQAATLADIRRGSLIPRTVQLPGDPAATHGFTSTGRQPSVNEARKAQWAFTEPGISRMFPADVGPGPLAGSIAAKTGPVAGLAGAAGDAISGVNRGGLDDAGQAIIQRAAGAADDPARIASRKARFVAETGPYRPRAGNLGEPAQAGQDAYFAFGYQGRARLTPARGLQTSLRKLGAEAPTMLEVQPEEFIRVGQMAQKSRGPLGKSVSVYTPDGYQGYKLFLSEDKTSGFAISPSGELSSVFSAKGSPNRGFSAAALPLAVQKGARWLNAFDTSLPDLYSRYGFKPVARIPFDEKIARLDWGDEAVDSFIADMKRLGHHGQAGEGRPDLVFMAYDPDFDGVLEAGQGIRAEGWDQAEGMVKDVARGFDLSPDTPARMKRADDLGFTEDRWYAGTLRDFPSYSDPTRDVARRHDSVISGTYMSDSYHGPGVYMTDNPLDASHNYARRSGGDWRMRQEGLIDELQNTAWTTIDDTAEWLVVNSDPEKIKAAIRDAGIPDDMLAKLVDDIQKIDRPVTGDYDRLTSYLETMERSGELDNVMGWIAERQIRDHEGLVMPLRTRAQNPVVVGRGDMPETTFDYTPPFDPDYLGDDVATGSMWLAYDAKPAAVARRDPELGGMVARIQKIQDKHAKMKATDELGRYLEAMDPADRVNLFDAIGVDMGLNTDYGRGQALEIAEMIRDRVNDLTGNEAVGDGLFEEIMNAVQESDGLRASDFEAIVRRSNAGEWIADEIGTGELIQEVYRALGYDAIDFQDAGRTFAGMPGVDYSTKHRVIFDPAKVRSEFAMFDPKKVDSTDLLAARASPSPGSLFGGGGAPGGDSAYTEGSQEPGDGLEAAIREYLRRKRPAGGAMTGGGIN